MDLPLEGKRFCPKEQAVCFRPSEEALNIAMSVFSGGGGGGGGAPSFSSVLLGLTSLSLTSVLVYMLTSQIHKYNDHTVGVTVRRSRDFSPLDFPAFSICSKYYDFGKLLDDLKVPEHPFRPRKAVDIRGDPSQAYGTMENHGMNIATFLWGYYFTLDKVIKRRGKSSRSTFASCHVGGVSCEPPRDEEMPPWPEKGDEVWEVSVPAGAWSSRFLVGMGEAGETVLCHTLKPNVSADFSRRGGGAFSMQWMDELGYKAPSWRIYVHDRNEQLILPSYSMVDMPFLSFRRVSLDGAETEEEEREAADRNQMSYKRKARILPEFHRRPGTGFHPCRDEEGYSQYRCELENNWSRRISSMEEGYGQRFDCVIPGLVVGEGIRVRYPLCSKSAAFSSNDSLGLVDLVRSSLENPLLEYEHLMPNLGSPPIGVEAEEERKEGSLDLRRRCLPRCSAFVYAMENEEEIYDDGDVQRNDVHIYFPSRSVETWTEFEEYSLVSLFSDVGGSMGLLMGLSILSLVELGMGAIGGIAKRMAGESKRGKKKEKF